MKTVEQVAAFTLGAICAKQGKAEAHCPYPYGHKQRKHWRDGWHWYRAYQNSNNPIEQVPDAEATTQAADRPSTDGDAGEGSG